MRLEPVALDLHRHLGVGLQVAVPGRCARRAVVGRDDDESVVLAPVAKDDLAGLPGDTASGGQDQHRTPFHTAGEVAAGGPVLGHDRAVERLHVAGNRSHAQSLRPVTFHDDSRGRGTPRPYDVAGCFRRSSSRPIW